MKEKRYRRTSGGRHAPFWGFETEIDWFGVLANDYAGSGVISASEEKVVCSRGHMKVK